MKKELYCGGVENHRSFIIHRKVDNKKVGTIEFVNTDSSPSGDKPKWEWQWYISETLNDNPHDRNYHNAPQSKSVADIMEEAEKTYIEARQERMSNLNGRWAESRRQTDEVNKRLTEEMRALGYDFIQGTCDAEVELKTETIDFVLWQIIAPDGEVFFESIDAGENELWDVARDHYNDSLDIAANSDN